MQSHVIQKTSFSRYLATDRATSKHQSERFYSKWSSLILSLANDGEFTLLGPGPRLIPVALPNLVAKHIQHKINAASLRANSLSQFISFHLSFNIASITGDHRLLLILLEHRSNDALVSLLGYSIAILYSSYFSLLLSAPSVSNPPTSYSVSYTHLTLPTIYSV